MTTLYTQYFIKLKFDIKCVYIMLFLYTLIINSLSIRLEKIYLKYKSILNNILNFNTRYTNIVVSLLYSLTI